MEKLARSGRSVGTSSESARIVENKSGCAIDVREANGGDVGDIDKLMAMVNDPKRPVQFVFAGKSHPHDEPGKRVLQQIAQLMRDPRFADNVIFVEDYDIDVGRPQTS